MNEPILLTDNIIRAQHIRKLIDRGMDLSAITNTFRTEYPNITEQTIREWITNEPTPQT